MSESGQIELPSHEIKLIWDPDAQELTFQFETSQFKSWYYVIAMLDMAKRKAEEKLQEQMVMARMVAMKQAHDEAQLRGKLLQR